MTEMDLWNQPSPSRPILFLAAVISILMAAHLLIFLFVPLGMSLAHIGFVGIVGFAPLPGHASEFMLKKHPVRLIETQKDGKAV